MPPLMFCVCDIYNSLHHLLITQILQGKEKGEETHLNSAGGEKKKKRGRTFTQNWLHQGSVAVCMAFIQIEVTSHSRFKLVVI